MPPLSVINQQAYIGATCHSDKNYVCRTKSSRGGQSRDVQENISSFCSSVGGGSEGGGAHLIRVQVVGERGRAVDQEVHQGVQAQPQAVHALRAGLPPVGHQLGVDDALRPLHRTLALVLQQQRRAAVHEGRPRVPAAALRDPPGSGRNAHPRRFPAAIRHVCGGPLAEEHRQGHSGRRAHLQPPVGREISAAALPFQAVAGKARLLGQNRHQEQGRTRTSAAHHRKPHRRSAACAYFK